MGFDQGMVGDVKVWIEQEKEVGAVDDWETVTCAEDV